MSCSAVDLLRVLHYDCLSGLQQHEMSSLSSSLALNLSDNDKLIPPLAKVAKRKLKKAKVDTQVSACTELKVKE